MKISDVKGIIFDVDDTLLDNYPPEIPHGLHEQSRLVAARSTGSRHGITALENFTKEQSVRAIAQSPTHSLHGAVWQMLVIAGEVAGADIDFDHPLLIEIVELKDTLHEQVLRSHAQEVPGATKFITALAKQHGLADKLAVASTAYRRDVMVFFEMTGLDKFFPEKRIITREQFVNPKPDPEAYEIAFKTLGLKSKKGVIAFEDDPRGVASAKGAGIYTCAITTRFTREELEGAAVAPDLIADSYAEFVKIFGLDW